MVHHSLTFSKMLRILKYAKPHSFLLITVIVLLLISTGIGLITPYLMKVLVDGVLIARNMDLFFVVLQLYAIVFAGGVVSSIALDYTSTFLTERLALDVKKDLFRHIERLHLQFFQKKKTGDILTRLDTDVYGIQNFIDIIFNVFFLNLLTGIGVLVISLYLSWQITLAALVVFPVYLMIQKHYSKKIRKQSMALRKKDADIMSFLEEDISSMKLIKSFKREKLELKTYVQKLQSMINLDLKMSLLRSFSVSAIGAVTFIPLFILLGFGGYQVIKGALSVGTLIALYTYLTQLFGPVSSLATIEIPMQETLASVDRVFEFLDETPKVQDRKGAKKLKKVEGRVEFKDVSFSYEKGVPVLKDVSFSAKPGKVIELIGSSGAGKTTIIDLLFRFYDPSKGSITIDGRDLRDIKIDSIREHVGIVSQETVLMDMSIAENIKFGNPKATMEDVIRVAKMANLHKFVSKLPNGYNTIVGERGAALSGGQKQRVAIARVLLKNPQIVILDEATSSLDVETEYKVKSALAKVLKGRTVIIITHRLSSARDSDTIYVLDKKTIAESGSYKELLKKKGRFYKLYKTQFKRVK